MHNGSEIIPFYKLPIVKVVSINGAISKQSERDFVYINISTIKSIWVNDENSNWSNVETTLAHPYTDIAGQAILVVPIQADDLMESIYDSYNTNRR
jgi:hypothetical protein